MKSIEIILNWEITWGKLLLNQNNCEVVVHTSVGICNCTCTMFEVGGGSVHPREVVKMLLTQSISSQVQKIRRLCRLLFYLREMCALSMLLWCYVMHSVLRNLKKSLIFGPLTSTPVDTYARDQRGIILLCLQHLLRFFLFFFWALVSSVWPAGFYLGLGIENLCTCERNVKKFFIGVLT